jgi:hypothetical protein
MGILLAFAPFIEFVVLNELLGSAEGLLAGIIMSAGLLIRDWMSADREPKFIEIGTAIFFCGLAVQALLLDSAWSIDGVRLRVDSGLLIMILVTLAIRQRFMLQYAREHVAPEFWESPEFVRTNYVVTAMWALAFSVVVIVEIILLQWPEVPPRVGILVTIAALVGAVKFTSCYPERRRAMLSKRWSNRFVGVLTSRLVARVRLIVSHFTYGEHTACSLSNAGDFRGQAKGATGTRHFELDGVIFQLTRETIFPTVRSHPETERL